MTRLGLHRRRRARDEMLAPWVAAAVILGGWGLAARFIAPEPASVMTAMDPSIIAPAASPQSVESPASPGTTRNNGASSLEPDASPATIGTRDLHGEVVPLEAAADDPDTTGDLALLRARNLLIPVAGVDRAALGSSFSDARGGSRVHEALDVLAPRGTPVVATEAGTIVKLFHSVRGGTTIYQFDPSGSFCYYYAHLDSYAPGLGQGDTVERGEIIGYVGTTGNAPPQTPHLHFAIFRLGPERHWWEGVAIDPYLVFH